jgi:hypothetical protein
MPDVLDRSFAPAHLVSARCTRGLLTHRTLRVVVQTPEPVTAQVGLLRDSARVRRKLPETVLRGTRELKLPLDDGVAAGPARVDVELIDRDGVRRSCAIAIRVPPLR